jgi:aminoglycoside/choline kinase family phosphotransferase
VTDRPLEIAGFLEQSGWADAFNTPLQADFSARQFARLVRGKDDVPRKAVLMDENGDSTQFVDIARFLKSMDVSAPEIYAEQAENGLVLMEDFGNSNFGRMIDGGTDAMPLYRRVVDMLVHMHKVFNRDAARSLDLPVFSAALFASQVEFFIDYWIPHEKKREATREESEGFREAWRQTLNIVDRLPQSFMLRDLTMDNIMDLPDRKDWRSVGVLDFQDGGIGPLPYDLMSLCEMVRRDTGGLAVMDELIDYYIKKAQPALSKIELRSACRILAAQRHTRILGVLARLAMKTGRTEKMAFAPRVWAFLDELLQDIALRPIAAWMDEYGPFR